jgi:Immunity protein 8
MSDRALLLLSKYSWRAVQRHVRNIVKRCESERWDDSVLKLQRYFQWEYEDYKVDRE